MTVLLLVASLGLGGAKALAALTFAALLSTGFVLYRKLGRKAQAEEAEALLDEEFARLESSANYDPMKGETSE